MSKYHLLSVENDFKTSKSVARGYLTGIMYLAPSTEADGKHDLCPMATEECRKACLYSSGQAQVFPNIKRGRIAKTLRYLNDRSAFVETLASEIRKLEKEALSRALKPAVRINGTSDLPKLALELAGKFPHIRFYDYTKIPRPFLRTRPNYHITFSFSGQNLSQSLEALQNGINVSVVFSGKVPDTWNGYPVISGDEDDLRFLDPAGVIVGLKVKGNDAKKMATGGFIQIGA